MWCPSATLSLWANAWLAGKAAPDDVLDALSCWAPIQSVTAYDSVAAGHTGLPWPDMSYAGAASLLQTLRSASGTPPAAAPSVNLVLPVPGDVRGLVAGTPFEQDALAAGEAVIVSDPRDSSVAIGLVPELRHAESDDGIKEGIDPEVCALSWTVYSLPGAPALDQYELGEAEYTLRSAVRSAAETLTRIGSSVAGPDVEDPRRLVQDLLEAMQHHRIPGHAPSRAVRVLETAAHVDAIITVSAGLTPSAMQSSSEVKIAGDALRPLAGVVRSARMAAVNATLQSAWRS
ncbi:hypothetical protein [Mycobacterium shimoidei]|uniref:hypothetical protein n=1 Tax=Mycobacterium shimoidei TaxID=29313 RepID=UPI0008485F5C|nr:hypothetical protein [Mycobacterium shimoidei]MCV7258281.1 hypothetical protein [Mycobacterium shimoidei]ODR12962.1 hypothetical protein BHQ16_12925 [Mycobacterium shimoidei]ORW82109.1 hypothetical protein AWC26_05500 [Mycobacterium shimoidei]